MVYEDNDLYSVAEMAQLLFGNTSATSCYASHRLLSQERTFFKQAGRSPPRFQARSEKDVHSLKTKRLVEEKVLTRCSICSYQVHGFSWVSRASWLEQHQQTEVLCKGLM